MDRPLITPESMRAAVRAAVVMSVRDLDVPGPHRAVRVRVYRPASPTPAPALLYFHGGGWVAGDLDTHDSFCRVLCEWAGCAVVATDYARPPEQRFPAAVEDCYGVTQWLARQGPSMGIDVNRIAVAGGGSGAGLAAVICQLARDQGGPSIGFQLLLYPLLDCLARNRSRAAYASGYGLTAELLRWYLSLYVPEGVSLAHPWLSPARHASLRNLPDALIVTAGCDLLRDEGRAYARHLKKAGAAVRHVNYPDMQHGFINYPAQHAAARKAIQLCVEALAGYFQAQPAGRA
jgi:acetyl esterase